MPISTILVNVVSEDSGTFIDGSASGELTDRLVLWTWTLGDICITSLNTEDGSDPPKYYANIFCDFFRLYFDARIYISVIIIP